MKHISTGAGLAVLGLCIAMHPLLHGLVSSATASAATAPTALASAESAQAEPNVVWMGVTRDYGYLYFHRLWSDGRIENRMCGYLHNTCEVQLQYGSCDWTELPPPPGGNGFACRTDVNGDRRIDGSDLAFVLNAWGQEGGCGPEPTYPCLDLGNLAGGVAVK